ncbi:hypothetical protein RI129_011230 [Pyrocoelia pectoralis]|uniref:SAM domain-containing protein n=1 Tax=Pyrocoelia pectoralis TaxID=417401 RepID=A0AAN7V5W2_9COLE
MDVPKLLHDWGFDSLITIFEGTALDCSIDYDALLLLTPEVIKNLIPKIGEQVKFIKRLEDYKLILQSDDKENNPVTPTTSSTVSEGLLSDGDVMPIERYTDTTTANTSLVTFYGEEEFQKILNPTKHFNLNSLLNESYFGKIIIKQYTENKTLDRKTRASLVDIIISHFFKTHGSYLTNDQLEDISYKIEAAFPNEKSEIYYVKPVKKCYSKYSKSLVARGKLVDRYRNYRTKLRVAGILPSTSTANQSNSWLETRTDPWNDVVRHWELTFELRQKCEVSNIHDFLTEWPPLKLSTGYSLIDVDFDRLFPDKGLLLHEKWDSFFNSVYTIKKDFVKDVGLEIIYLLENESLNQSSKTAIQILLLPYLIPPKGRARKGKEHWKASILECQQSLIVHAKIPADIERLIEDKVNKSKEAKQTIQPYIIVLGPLVSEIQQAYVILDKVRYSFDNTLRALEICFKAFHTCNLYYPFQSEHIYMLLQLCLFKIKTKWDKTIPYIMDLVTTLDAS